MTLWQCLVYVSCIHSACLVHQAAVKQYKYSGPQPHASMPSAIMTSAHSRLCCRPCVLCELCPRTRAAQDTLHLDNAHADRCCKVQATLASFQRWTTTPWPVLRPQLRHSPGQMTMPTRCYLPEIAHAQWRRLHRLHNQVRPQVLGLSSDTSQDGLQGRKLLLDRQCIC